MRLSQVASSAVCALSIALLGSGGLRAQTSGTSAVLELKASEVYVQFYPLDKLVRIREYGLRTSSGDEEEARNQADELTSLIERAAYCEARYGLDGFKSGQELLFSVRHTQTGDIAVHAECMMVTATDMPGSMDTVFRNILARPVSIGRDREEALTMVFDATGVDVGPTNAKIFQNDNTGQIMLAWSPGERFYDAVFILAQPDPSRPMFPYLPSLPVSSPELDQAQVEELRNSL